MVARACCTSGVFRASKSLPIDQAKPFSNLALGGLGLAEQVLGVLIVHARHDLAGVDKLAALDEDLDHSLFDLGGDVGLGVRHQSAGHVQGRRQVPLPRSPTETTIGFGASWALAGSLASVLPQPARRSRARGARPSRIRSHSRLVFIAATPAPWLRD